MNDVVTLLSVNDVLNVVRYWLRLLDTGENDSIDKTRDALIQEATELMNIFGAIVRKSE